MEERYKFKEIESKIAELWEKGTYFTPPAPPKGRTFSMFFMPPNASGPLHVGNALMIAIQDVLARYNRGKGIATLWVPGTDHGGYETQVTYEREIGEFDAHGLHRRKDQFEAIKKFVEKNNKIIVQQIKTMGASVDWSRFRFTLDEEALGFVQQMFQKMMGDNLIYRDSYMVNYCSECATVLADIELKEIPTKTTLYSVQFAYKDEETYIALATTTPEFLYAATHVLVHPQDGRYASYIGKTLLNPVTGEDVHIIESKRKYDPASVSLPLFVFSPSSKKYDFEYAIRNGISTTDLFTWEGTLMEPYAGMVPKQAREVVLAELSERKIIESLDSSYPEAKFVCKKGHTALNIIRMTWFLKLDDEKISLRKNALDALLKENPIITPSWRKKGLLEWIGKMHDWPIARQNVWGIKIPVWYEVTDPSLFTIWFVDENGIRHTGNLESLLDEGFALQKIFDGLERVYAAPGCIWTLEQEDDKIYLPETDTFDTWFSSCVWGLFIYGDIESSKYSEFYPSNIIVLGHDLLRLFIARKILLGQYLNGKIPFKRVYFHQLLKSEDGQKMSKSLGNAVTLDHYLKEYGADVTRLALVSYTGIKEDFVFSTERLELYKNFIARLWNLGRVCETVNMYFLEAYNRSQLSAEDTQLLEDQITLANQVGNSIDKYFLAQAQETAVLFLIRLEATAEKLLERSDAEEGLAVLYAVFKEYLFIMHPFAPFVTEILYKQLYKSPLPLAAATKSSATTKW